MVDALSVPKPRIRGNVFDQFDETAPVAMEPPAPDMDDGDGNPFDQFDPLPGRGALGQSGMLTEAESHQAALDAWEQAKADLDYWNDPKNIERERSEQARKAEIETELVPQQAKILGVLPEDVDQALGPIESPDDFVARKQRDANAAAAKARMAVLGLGGAPTQTTWRNAVDVGVRGLLEMGPDAAKAAGIIPEAVEYYVTAATKGQDAAEALPNADNALIRAADEADKWIAEAFPGDPARAKEFTSQLASGAGGLTGFLVGGVAGRALGAVLKMSPRVAGAVSAGGLGGGVQGTAGYEDAQRAGATNLAKYHSFFLNAGLGTTEAIPIDRFFGRLNAATGGRVASMLDSTQAQSIEEFTQEVVQSIGADAIAKAVYDTEREIDVEGALVQGAIGGVLGGVLGAAGGAAARPAARAAGSDPTTAAVNTLRSFLGGQQVSPEQAAQTEEGTEAEPPIDGEEDADLPEGAVPAETLYPEAREEIAPEPPIDGAEAAPQTQAPATAPEQPAEGERPPADAAAPTAPTHRFVQGAAPPEMEGADLTIDPDQEGVNSDVAVRVILPDGRRHVTGKATIEEAEADTGPAIADLPAEDVSLLKSAGYRDDQILDMGDEQRAAEVAEAKAQGVAAPNAFDRFDRPAGPAAPRENEGEEEMPAAPVHAPVEQGSPGTRAAPVRVETAEDLAKARAAAREPRSEAEAEAGTYPKAHVEVQGLKVSIETPKGAERRGKTRNGREWRVAMPADYGYFVGQPTRAKDKEHVDVYVGDQPQSGRAFVVDQKDLGTGRFDEPKVMLGFTSRKAAVQAYKAGFSDGRGSQRISAVTEVSVDDLKTWLKEGDATKPFAPQKPPPATARTEESQPAERRQARPRSTGRAASLLQFLKSKGGVRDQRGELAAMDLRTRFPGLVSRRGMTHDHAREVAAEAGYLDHIYGSPERAMAQSTVADFLDLLPDADRAFAAEDQEAVQARQRKEDDRRDQEKRAGVEDEIRAFMRKNRLDASDSDMVSRAAGLLEAGGITNIDDALERAAIELDQEEDSRAEPAGEDQEVPFAEEAETGGLAPARERDGAGRQAGGEERSRRGDVVQEEGEAGEDDGAAERPDRLGATRRVKPDPRQTDLFGGARASDADMAQRGADAPLKPKVAQNLSMDEGLFGDDARQVDLVDEVRRAERQPAISAEDAALLEGLPEGSHFRRGKGVLGSKSWGVFDADGKMVWNLAPTKEEAAREARQHLSNRASYAEEARRQGEREADIVQRLLAGGEPTDADIRALGLKPVANFEFLSPTVQRLFGISRTKVREAMGDALRIGHTDSGAEFWRGDAKRALMNAAAFASRPSPGRLASTRAAPSSPSLRRLGLPSKGLASIARWNHPRMLRTVEGYDAAKAGDMEAAVRFVPQSISDEMVTAAQQLGTDVIYVAPHAEEASGRNAIPQTMARYLAEVTGAESDRSIIQSNRAYHTGARPIDRLIGRAGFGGPVQAGRRYVIVDDVTVIGGTIAELANHIRSNGGEVAGVVTLVNASRNGIRGASRQDARKIEERYGDEVRNAFGLDPSALTADEARVILNYRDVDALRVAIAKGQQERDRRLREKGLRPSEAEDGVGPSGRLASASPSPSPPFYSAALRAIEASPQPRATAQQWLGILRKTPGVKREELEWLGVEEWLRDQRASVSREVLADFIRANQIEVRDVVKSWPDDTKFGAYTLPGGESYRELLLTLSPPPSTRFSAEDLPSDWRVEKAPDGSYRVRDADNQVVGFGDTPDLAAAEALSIAEELDRGKYRSPHFDEPNILAHVRFNDRTDAYGKRTLFIEEVQSDWHQAGRKRGYAGKGRDVVAIDRDLDEIRAEMIRRDPRLDRDDATAGDWQRAWDANPELRTRNDALYRERGNRQDAVPDAPFKTTWPELALKRMVRWAAENGYDQVAWTPGSVQAERYDLSKQVDKITAEMSADGDYLIGLFKDGRDLSGRSVPAGELDAFVGKELADRIRSEVTSAQDPEVTYQGLDLKVGGEGMIAFYDRMLPNAANKLGKRFGAKVGEATIAASPDMEPQDLYPGWQDDDAVAVKVHALPITESMRDSVMQGQPLFRRDRARPIEIIPPQDRALLENNLRSIVSRIAGRRVDVQFADQIAIEEALGEAAASDMRRAADAVGDRLLSTAGGYWDPDHVSAEALIKVALSDPAFDPLTTAFHEAWHHVEMALMTAEERRVLASQMPRLRALAAEEIGADFAETIPDYEVTAIAFQRYARARHNKESISGIHSALRRFFERVLDFIRRAKAMIGKETDEAKVRRAIDAWFAAAYEGAFAERAEGEAAIEGALAVTSPLTQTPAFKRWFGDSKVVDQAGRPLVVYHGARRSDRIAEAGQFDRTRATSGPMAFFSDSPEIASRYSEDKADTSLVDEGYNEWFRVRTPKGLVTIDQVWNSLSGVERSRIRQLAPQVTQDDEGDIIIEEGNRRGIGNYDYEIRESRGDALKALVEGWLNGGTLIGQEERFREVLRKAGMTTPVEFHDPHAEYPGVFPVYLSIQNPFDTSHITEADIERFAAAAENAPQPQHVFGLDPWDKNARDPAVWMEELRSDFETGDTHAWTSIPDWVTAVLREQGYDGIKDTGGKLGGEEHAVWIPFSETQVKSVANRGTFDPDNPSILASSIPLQAHTPAQRSHTNAWSSRADRVRSRVRDAADVVRVYAQDRYLPIRRLQEAIEAEAGFKITTPLDAYQAIRIYVGRTGERLVDLQRDHIDPLVEAMREKKITADQLDQYLYARHAPERNAAMAKINPKVGDSGSGMSDQDAARIIAGIKKDGRLADYEAIAARIDAIIAETRKELVASGLIDAKTALRWSQTYQHYVPLRGFDDAAAHVDAFGVGKGQTGRGFDVRGQESKQALGRRTKADSPLAYVIQQAEQAIVRAEKNRALKTVLRFAQDPEVEKTGLFKIDRAETRRRINPKTGLVEFYEVPPQFSKKDNLFSVKIGGKTHWIEVNHDGYARSLRGVGSSIDNGLARALLSISHTYAKLLTQWNPEFVPTNAVRDIQTALVNVSEFSHLAAGTRRQILKDAFTLRSVRGAIAAMYGRSTNNEMAGWYDEYRRAGGKVSFIEMNDVDRIKRKIGRQVDAGQAMRALMTVGDLVGNLNTAVENGARLSVYANLRRHGVEQDRAALIARDLTTDFNLRGEWSPTINALYIFFNASLQGGIRLARAVARSKAARVAVGGIFSFGFAMEFMNAMIAGGDDDEDNPYDDIPEFVRERNIIIMLPDGNYITLPLAYGYNVPYVAGQQLAAVLRGKREPAEAALTVGGTAMDSFNPLGSFGSFTQFVAPWFVDPAVQIGENKTFYGAPLMPRKFDDRKPDSELYWKSAPSWARLVARELNEATGGNVGRPGFIDISPETIQHYVEFAAGGVGRFLSNSVATAERMLKAEEWLPEDTPFVRRFFHRQDTGVAVQREYFDTWTKVDQAHYEQLQLAKAGDESAQRRAREEHRAELNSYGAFKAAEKQRKGLREAMLAAERIESSKRRFDRMNELEASIRTVMERALKRYALAQRGNSSER